MRLFLATMLLFLTACMTSAKNEERAVLYVQIGNDHLEQKNYAEALVAFREAEKLSPNNAVVLNSLSQLYLARDQHKISLDYIQRALKNDPNYSDARNSLGRLYIAMGQYDRSIKEFKTVLKDLTYMESEKTHTNLGLAYLRKGDFQKARQNFLQALKIKGQHCPAYNYYGQTLLKLQNYDSAASMFDQALKYCETSLEEIQYHGALSYYKLGKKDIAIAKFKEVINQYPASEFSEKSRSLLKVIE